MQKPAIRSHLLLHIMACTVHYDNYVDHNEKLNPLSKEKYERLLVAVDSRLELGGANLHEVQSSQIPKQFIENLVVHDKCYKKFTGAISVAKKNVPSTSESSTRPHRSGDLGNTLLPLHCMFCLKETPIKVKGKKQAVRKLTLLSAEQRVRLAVEMKKDERLLAVIRGFDSLLSAEFRCHEKCQSDYVRCVPATKKREKTVETVENVDGSVIGSKMLRKRQKVTGCSMYLEDGIEEGKDSPDFSLDASPESTIDTAVESAVDTPPE